MKYYRVAFVRNLAPMGHGARIVRRNANVKMQANAMPKQENASVVPDMEVN